MPENVFPKVDGDELFASETNSFAGEVTAKTSNYTITSGECTGARTFTNEGATGSITFTLPEVNDSRRITIINSEDEDLVVSCGGSDKIYGVDYPSGVTSLTLSNQYSSIVLSKIGTDKWYLKESNNVVTTVKNQVILNYKGNLATMSGSAITIPSSIKRIAFYSGADGGSEGSITVTINNTVSNNYFYVRLYGYPNSSTKASSDGEINEDRWHIGVAGDVEGWIFNGDVVMDYTSDTDFATFNASHAQGRDHSSGRYTLTKITGNVGLTAQPTTITFSGISGTGFLKVIGYKY